MQLSDEETRRALMEMRLIVMQGCGHCVDVGLRSPWSNDDELWLSFDDGVRRWARGCNSNDNDNRL